MKFCEGVGMLGGALHVILFCFHTLQVLVNYGGGMHPMPCVCAAVHRPCRQAYLVLKDPERQALQDISGQSNHLAILHRRRIYDDCGFAHFKQSEACQGPCLRHAKP